MLQCVFSIWRSKATATSIQNAHLMRIWYLDISDELLRPARFVTHWLLSSFGTGINKTESSNTIKLKLSRREPVFSIATPGFCQTIAQHYELLQVNNRLFRSALRCNVSEEIKGWQTWGCTTLAPPGRMRDTLVNNKRNVVFYLNSLDRLSYRLWFAIWTIAHSQRFILEDHNRLVSQSANILTIWL